MSLINFIASLLGAGGIQAFKTMRTLRALRPLRAMSRMQGMRVSITGFLLVQTKNLSMYFFFLQILGSSKCFSASHSFYFQCIIGLFNLLAYFRHYGSTAVCRKIFQGKSYYKQQAFIEIKFSVCQSVGLLIFFDKIEPPKNTTQITKKKTMDKYSVKVY